MKRMPKLPKIPYTELTYPLELDADGHLTRAYLKKLPAIEHKLAIDWAAVLIAQRAKLEAAKKPKKKPAGFGIDFPIDGPKRKTAKKKAAKKAGPPPKEIVVEPRNAVERELTTYFIVTKPKTSKTASKGLIERNPLTDLSIVDVKQRPTKKKAKRKGIPKVRRKSSGKSKLKGFGLL